MNLEMEVLVLYIMGKLLSEIEASSGVVNNKDDEGGAPAMVLGFIKGILSIGELLLQVSQARKWPCDQDSHGFNSSLESDLQGTAGKKKKWPCDGGVGSEQSCVDQVKENRLL
ncbi:unnamed protein product [Linum trigynum]|uniref:Uncharacterized protein n=1 Tax=Linum trigynum TaxID=586398 RepID=A0AAV2CD54_9ROSI